MSIKTGYKPGRFPPPVITTFRSRHVDLKFLALQHADELQILPEATADTSVCRLRLKDRHLRNMRTSEQ